MPLSSHTTSLELSLALREAGYPQSDSLFIWTRAWTRKGGTLRKDGKWYIAYNQYHGEGNLAAPLASELLATLPKHVKGHVLQICPGFKEGGWFAGYGDHMNLNGFLVEDGDTFCEAVGKLFLHLRKASLI